MNSDNWGKCKDCKFWQIEPEAAANDRTMGVCIVDQLEDYRLRVSGNSGCNLFAPGKARHAEGSSEAPPRAVAVH